MVQTGMDEDRPGLSARWTDFDQLLQIEILLMENRMCKGEVARSKEDGCG
jgi:hypothetical protein